MLRLYPPLYINQYLFVYLKLAFAVTPALWIPALSLFLDFRSHLIPAKASFHIYVVQYYYYVCFVLLFFSILSDNELCPNPELHKLPFLYHMWGFDGSEHVQ